MTRGADQRRYEYERWLASIERDYPEGYYTMPTRFGCEVRDADDNLVEEWDYDPPEDNPAIPHY